MRHVVALMLSIVTGMLLGWPGAVRAESALWTAIGFSQGGLPLVVHQVGEGSLRVLILGGQHGGPEANTIELAEGLLAYYREDPSRLPAGLRLDILAIANPDGAQVGIRQFLSGVDPNRNWGGADWRADGWDSNGVFREGLGGSRPFSEPETRALRDWIRANRPALIINYHSAGGFMFGSREGLAGELANAYATASDYYFPARGAPRLLGYSVTGSMGAWMRDENLPGIFVELTTPWDPELERNLAGLRAVLARLALEVRPGPTPAISRSIA